jgi:hypothetical protein
LSPSIPNLLKLPNLLPRKSIKAWSLASLLKVESCSSLVSSFCSRDSIFYSSSILIKSLSALLSKCMY